MSAAPKKVVVCHLGWLDFSRCFGDFVLGVFCVSHFFAEEKQLLKEMPTISFFCWNLTPNGSNWSNNQ